MPLLTLDEFFAGNSDEDAIAPNQENEGRPKIAEIYEKFKSLENHDNIAWIRVLLHDDTEMIKDGDDEKITLYGESILICIVQLNVNLTKSYIINFLEGAVAITI